jgi:hypothetical protein
VGVAQGVAELVLEFEPVEVGDRELGGVDGAPALALSFRRLHGDVGVTHDRLAAGRGS